MAYLSPQKPSKPTRSPVPTPVAPLLKSGYLLVQTDTSGGRRWLQRHAILTGQSLEWYTDATMETLIGGVSLSGATALLTPPEDSPSENQFELDWEGQDYLPLRAVSSADLSSWVGALRQTISIVDATLIRAAAVAATRTAFTSLSSPHSPATSQAGFGLAAAGTPSRPAVQPVVLVDRPKDRAPLPLPLAHVLLAPPTPSPAPAPVPTSSPDASLQIPGIHASAVHGPCLQLVTAGAPPPPPAAKRSKKGNVGASSGEGAAAPLASNTLPQPVWAARYGLVTVCPVPLLQLYSGDGLLELSRLAVSAGGAALAEHTSAGGAGVPEGGTLLRVTVMATSNGPQYKDDPDHVLLAVPTAESPYWLAALNSTSDVECAKRLESLESGGGREGAGQGRESSPGKEMTSPCLAEAVIIRPSQGVEASLQVLPQQEEEAASRRSEPSPVPAHLSSALAALGLPPGTHLSPSLRDMIERDQARGGQVRGRLETDPPTSAPLPVVSGGWQPPNVGTGTGTGGAAAGAGLALPHPSRRSPRLSAIGPPNPDLALVPEGEEGDEEEGGAPVPVPMPSHSLGRSSTAAAAAAAALAASMRANASKTRTAGVVSLGGGMTWGDRIERGVGGASSQPHDSIEGYPGQGEVDGDGGEYSYEVFGYGEGGEGGDTEYEEVDGGQVVLGRAVSPAPVPDPLPTPQRERTALALAAQRVSMLPTSAYSTVPKERADTQAGDSDGGAPHKLESPRLSGPGPALLQRLAGILAPGLPTPHSTAVTAAPSLYNSPLGIQIERQALLDKRKDLASRFPATASILASAELGADGGVGGEGDLGLATGNDSPPTNARSFSGSRPTVRVGAHDSGPFFASRLSSGTAASASPRHTPISPHVPQPELPVVPADAPALPLQAEHVSLPPSGATSGAAPPIDAAASTGEVAAAVLQEGAVEGGGSSSEPEPAVVAQGASDVVATEVAPSPSSRLVPHTAHHHQLASPYKAALPLPPTPWSRLDAVMRFVAHELVGLSDTMGALPPSSLGLLASVPAIRVDYGVGGGLRLPEEEEGYGDLDDSDDPLRISPAVLAAAPSVLVYVPVADALNRIIAAAAACSDGGSDLHALPLPLSSSLKADLRVLDEAIHTSVEGFTLTGQDAASLLPAPVGAHPPLTLRLQLPEGEGTAALTRIARILHGDSLLPTCLATEVARGLANTLTPIPAPLPQTPETVLDADDAAIALPVAGVQEGGSPRHPTRPPPAAPLQAASPPGPSSGPSHPLLAPNPSAHKDALRAFYSLHAPAKATAEHAAAAWAAYGVALWSALADKYGTDKVAPFAVSVGLPFHLLAPGRIEVEVARAGREERESSMQEAEGHAFGGTAGSPAGRSHLAARLERSRRTSPRNDAEPQVENLSSSASPVTQTDQVAEAGVTVEVESESAMPVVSEVIGTQSHARAHKVEAVTSMTVLRTKLWDANGEQNHPAGLGLTASALLTASSSASSSYASRIDVTGEAFARLQAALEGGGGSEELEELAQAASVVLGRERDSALHRHTLLPVVQPEDVVSFPPHEPFAASEGGVGSVGCDEGTQTEAMLAQAELAQAVLAQAVLAQAELAQAELAQAELAQAELAQAVLAQAVLAQAELAQAVLAQAELAQAELALVELACEPEAKVTSVEVEVIPATPLPTHNTGGAGDEAVEGGEGEGALSGALEEAIPSSPMDLELSPTLARIRLEMGFLSDSLRMRNSPMRDSEEKQTGSGEERGLSGPAPEKNQGQDASRMQQAENKAEDEDEDEGLVITTVQAVAEGEAEKLDERAVGQPTEGAVQLEVPPLTVDEGPGEQDLLGRDVIVHGSVTADGAPALGVVRFLGPVHFGPHPSSPQYGVELDQPVGTGDRSVDGTRYFTCAANEALGALPGSPRSLPYAVFVGRGGLGRVRPKHEASGTPALQPEGEAIARAVVGDAPAPPSEPAVVAGDALAVVQVADPPPHTSNEGKPPKPKGAKPGKEGAPKPAWNNDVRRAQRVPGQQVKPPSSSASTTSSCVTSSCEEGGGRMEGKGGSHSLPISVGSSVAGRKKGQGREMVQPSPASPATDPSNPPHTGVPSQVPARAPGPGPRQPRKNVPGRALAAAGVVLAGKGKATGGGGKARGVGRSSEEDGLGALVEPSGKAQEEADHAPAALRTAAGDIFVLPSSPARVTRATARATGAGARTPSGAGSGSDRVSPELLPTSFSGSSMLASPGMRGLDSMWRGAAVAQAHDAVEGGGEGEGQAAVAPLDLAHAADADLEVDAEMDPRVQAWLSALGLEHLSQALAEHIAVKKVREGAGQGDRPLTVPVLLADAACLSAQDAHAIAHACAEWRVGGTEGEVELEGRRVADADALSHAARALQAVLPAPEERRDSEEKGGGRKGRAGGQRSPPAFIGAALDRAEKALSMAAALSMKSRGVTASGHGESQAAALQAGTSGPPIPITVGRGVGYDEARSPPYPSLALSEESMNALLGAPPVLTVLQSRVGRVGRGDRGGTRKGLPLATPPPLPRSVPGPSSPPHAQVGVAGARAVGGVGPRSPSGLGAAPTLSPYTWSRQLAVAAASLRADKRGRDWGLMQARLHAHEAQAAVQATPLLPVLNPTPPPTMVPKGQGWSSPSSSSSSLSGWVHPLTRALGAKDPASKAQEHPTMRFKSLEALKALPHPPMPTAQAVPLGMGMSGPVTPVMAGQHADTAGDFSLSQAHGLSGIHSAVDVEDALASGPADLQNELMDELLRARRLEPVQPGLPVKAEARPPLPAVVTEGGVHAGEGAQEKREKKDKKDKGDKSEKKEKREKRESRASSGYSEGEAVAPAPVPAVPVLSEIDGPAPGFMSPRSAATQAGAPLPDVEEGFADWLTELGLYHCAAPLAAHAGVRTLHQLLSIGLSLPDTLSAPSSSSTVHGLAWEAVLRAALGPEGKLAVPKDDMRLLAAAAAKMAAR